MFEKLLHLLHWSELPLFGKQKMKDLPSEPTSKGLSDLLEELDAMPPEGDVAFSKMQLNLSMDFSERCVSYSRVERLEDIEQSIQGVAEYSQPDFPRFGKRFCESRAQSMRRRPNPAERVSEIARAFAPSDAEDPQRCWARIAVFGKQLGEQLIGNGFIAELYLKRLKRQQNISPKKMLFLKSSWTVLGVSNWQDFQTALSQCIPQFESALETLKKAFQSGDTEQAQAAQTRLAEVSSRFPLHAQIWADWHAQMKRMPPEQLSGDTLLMTKDEYGKLEEKVDRIISDLKEFQEQICRYNYGLSVRAAYQKRIPENQFEDAVFDSWEFLQKIVERFDYTREIQFSSYAMPALLHRIVEFVTSQGIVSVSNRDYILWAKIKRYCEWYRSINGNEPTVQCLANEFDVSANKIESVLSNSCVYTINVDQDTLNGDPLDTPQNILDVSEYCDPYDDPAERIADEERRNALSSALGSLTEQQRTVIVMCFGLYESPKPYIKMSQAEVSRHLGISRVRVSQLYDSAMKNLRKKMNAHEY